jgi:MinD-like ATPase involved in chromosome partitioning or flagellar assembly
MSTSNAAVCESRAILICPNQVIRTGVFSALMQAGVRDAVKVEEYPRVYGASSVIAGSRICLLDVCSDKPLALRLAATIAAADIPVIAVHEEADSDLTIECLRRGVIDFITVPTDAGQIKRTLERVAARTSYTANAVRKPGAVYAIMSGKGGAGGTTIAAHLALRIAEASPRKTLLVDVDGITGTIAFLLGLTPAFSLMDVAVNSWRMDEDLWQTFRATSGPLDVLLAPHRAVSIRVNADELSNMLDFWRSCYEVVILDLPTCCSDAGIDLARLAELVLIVATNEAACVYSTMKTIQHLEQCSVPSGAIKIVHNRHAGTSSDPLQLALQREVLGRVCEAGKLLERALLDAKPAPADSAFSSDIAALARTLTGLPVAEARQRGAKRTIMALLTRLSKRKLEL